ncbi:MAG: GDYXXLXY domain-containing protein [Hyphomicrobiaceae bacterium]
MSLTTTAKRWADHPFASIIAATAILTAILVYMVADRVMLIENGREVVLKVRPVDPRDLFKGDYVRLSYDISSLGNDVMTPEARQHWTQHIKLHGDRIYVVLEQQADTSWKPVAISETLPKSLPPNRVVLAGHAVRWDPSRVRYGLERYYIPEGTGRELEDLARKSEMSVIVSVDSSGRSAVKGIVRDGKHIYEPPLL